jgi:uncharacterized protein
MEYRSPDETGRLDGMAWCLWLPDEVVSGRRPEPVPAVMILHGAGSRKENHADFARAAASYGFAALTFDNRGHGETEGDMGPETAGDVVRLAQFLSERDEIATGRIAVRGSSMGGMLAIHLAADSPHVAAVVAICPAAEWMLLEDVQRLADGRPAPAGSALNEMRIDATGLAAWLDVSDVADAVERMGSKPLLLIHARGDEVVPSSHSEQLYERAAEPRRLLLLEGGNHRSAQHDAEVQGESLRWLSGVLGAG